MARVLILDGSLEASIPLAEAFEDVGVEPVPVRSIAAARGLLAPGHDFALITLDLVLPDGHATRFLDELRSDPGTCKLPAFVISNHLGITERLAALEAGATDYHGWIPSVGSLAVRGLGLAGLTPRRSASAMPTVLLIDDSPTIRGALRERIEAGGCEVVEASDGAEGLAIARKVRPAVIVVDQVMPGLDGISVVRRVRLDPVLRLVPVLVLTGHGDSSHEMAGLDAGADAYLRKSDPLDVIVARVLAAVRQSVLADPTPASETCRVLLQACIPATTQRICDLLRADDCDVAFGRCCDPALAAWEARQPPDAVVTAAPPSECTHAFDGIHGRSVPLIVAGSDASAARVREILDHGADDFLADTTDGAVLVARIRAHVRRKQADDTVQRTREALERAMAAERVKSMFFANMSHELRTPLNAILGYSEMLLEDEHENARAEDLRRIMGAGRHLLDLINEVLDFSKINDKKLVLAPAPTGVAETLESVVSLVKPLAQRNGNRVAVGYGATTPPIVQVDPLRLKQILINLSSNASKFTHDGEIKLSSRGETINGRPHVVFEVSDTGIGIPDAKLGTIFEPFAQVDGSTTRKYGGTGLGLTITRSLAQMMGGDVSVASVVGHGSTFTVRLPVGSPEPEEVVAGL